MGNVKSLAWSHFMEKLNAEMNGQLIQNQINSSSRNLTRPFVQLCDKMHPSLKESCDCYSS